MSRLGQLGRRWDNWEGPFHLWTYETEAPIWLRDRRNICLHLAELAAGSVCLVVNHELGSRRCFSLLVNALSCRRRKHFGPGTCAYALQVCAAQLWGKAGCSSQEDDFSLSTKQLEQAIPCKNRTWPDQCNASCIWMAVVCSNRSAFVPPTSLQGELHHINYVHSASQCTGSVGALCKFIE